VATTACSAIEEPFEPGGPERDRLERIARERGVTVAALMRWLVVQMAEELSVETFH
jgi:hypothetical protein